VLEKIVSVKQIFACIGFLPFIVLSFNTHSAGWVYGAYVSCFSD
jgi:hypothetical protein